jgi:sterol desaturase/sphingolipid hydroxylase (fatty acid hydroxylase superfamily)
MLFNVIGHTGYEYDHRRFIDTWFLRTVVNTPTAHAMHHEKFAAITVSTSVSGTG